MNAVLMFLMFALYFGLAAKLGAANRDIAALETRVKVLEASAGPRGPNPWSGASPW